MSCNTQKVQVGIGCELHFVNARRQSIAIPRKFRWGLESSELELARQKNGCCNTQKLWVGIGILHDSSGSSSQEELQYPKLRVGIGIKKIPEPPKRLRDWLLLLLAPLAQCRAEPMGCVLQGKRRIFSRTCLDLLPGQIISSVFQRAERNPFQAPIELFPAQAMREILHSVPRICPNGPVDQVWSGLFANSENIGNIHRIPPTHATA